MIALDDLSTLPMPTAFGIEVDLQTGEMRTQTGPGQYEIDHFERVANNYLLRSAARKLLSPFRVLKNEAQNEFPAYRVVRCGLGVLNQKTGVGIYKAMQHKRAHFGGIVQCGSVWHCAVCSNKISVRRRAELVIATNRINEDGGSCGLLTCTVPHAASDVYSEVTANVKKLYDRMNSGVSAKNFRERFEVVGSIKALEFTIGLNGIHPHIHSLMYCNRPVNWIELSDLLYLRYAAAAKSEFGWNLPRLALDLRGGNKASDYVAKWGIESEITGGAHKKARGESLTPFELLELYGNGDKAAGQTWVNFATSISPIKNNKVTSSRQLVWSRGLKERFGIDDMTDEQIAEQQEEPAVLLGSIDFEQWLKVLSQPYDARVVLLQIASVGTFSDVLTFINQLPTVATKPRN
jgi:hypothetical protein